MFYLFISCFIFSFRFLSSKVSSLKREDKSMSCSQCNKEFSSRGNLNQHMQLHTGQFRHHCLICRKGFNATSHYKIHMRSHEGVKYHCDYCAKPFVNKQRYRYHLSVHTGQYRFKCNMCEKGFNDRRKYENHVSSHEWIGDSIGCYGYHCQVLVVMDTIVKSAEKNWTRP